MELDAHAATDDECLRPGVGLRQEGGAGRRGERVEVPLEPRPLGDEPRLLRARRKPADLRLRPAGRLTAESPGEELAAEADPQVGDAGVMRLAEERLLALEPRDGVVERGELGAERDDQRVVPRIDRPRLCVDAEDVDLGSSLLEPVVDEASRRRPLVLDDERAQATGPVLPGQRGSPASTGALAVASSPSTSRATRRTAAAKRLTISASSSSELVKGGANRLWSPA
jgi:hypothetical protein